MNILKEFKAFAMKGNVVDMAIGVVIGGAFGKIVTSLVNDMIMPVFSLCGSTKRGIRTYYNKLWFIFAKCI